MIHDVLKITMLFCMIVQALAILTVYALWPLLRYLCASFDGWWRYERSWHRARRKAKAALKTRRI